jgi:hypothetical protein
MSTGASKQRLATRWLWVYALSISLVALLVPAHGESAQAWIAPLLEWVPAFRRFIELSRFPLATAWVILLVACLSPIPFKWTWDRISHEHARHMPFGKLLGALSLLSLVLLGLLWMVLRDDYSGQVSRATAIPALMGVSRVFLALGAPFLGTAFAGLVACWWAMALGGLDRA